MVLLYFILPLWLLAGFCDWLCHRATDIAHTTGRKETLIHFLMFAEAGIPLIAALLLEINALIIAVMIVLFFIHEMTALWDVNIAIASRYVSPYEQHVHSFLEMLPLMAVLLVCILHWPQFLSLFGAGDVPADFRLRMREEPLPMFYMVSLFLGIIFLELFPYAEEYLRGRRAKKE